MTAQIFIAERILAEKAIGEYDLNLVPLPRRTVLVRAPDLNTLGGLCKGFRSLMGSYGAQYREIVPLAVTGRSRRLLLWHREALEPTPAWLAKGWILSARCPAKLA